MLFQLNCWVHYSSPDSTFRMSEVDDRWFDSAIFYKSLYVSYTNIATL